VERLPMTTILGGIEALWCVRRDIIACDGAVSRRKLDMEVKLSHAFAARLQAINPAVEDWRPTPAAVLVVSARGVVVEKAVADCWAKGTFDTPADSLAYHFVRHGAGRTLRQYTYDAARFFEKYKHEARWGRWNHRWAEAFQLIKAGEAGYFTPGGRILSYWNPDEQGKATL
jgi:hypothetical protein